MKTRQCLIAMFTALALFSCSQENDPGNDLTGNGETSYMSLTFPEFSQAQKAAKGTRADDPNQSVKGTDAENKMNSATVLLFNAENKCLGTRTFAAFTAKPATEAKAVPAKTAKVFVIINKPTDKFDFTSVEGQSWNTIKSRIVVVTSADIATDSKFMMTSSGDLSKGGLTDVNVYKTEGDAKNNPNPITVDRVAAKVQVSSASATATDATFTFKGWELNTVNKATSIYTERVAYASASTAAVQGVYREDHNYTAISGDDNAQKTYMEKNYTWLTNGEDATKISDISKATTDVAYCTENTMAAAAQLWGQTTKVVVKAEYTPSNEADGTALAAKSSYFSWNGYYYSVTGMKNTFKTNSGLKTDLITFLADAGATTITDKSSDTEIEAAIDGLGAYSGIKARYNAVKYYHLSVCYYDALIRHDKNVTTNMELGRYGVVRNNSYLINITAVNGPGTPWIPDPTDSKDPTNPTDPKPTDPDDAVDANLSIQVTVNNWTYWSHDTELG